MTAAWSGELQFKFCCRFHVGYLSVNMQHWLGLQVVSVKTLHLIVCFPHFLFYSVSFSTGCQCVLSLGFWFGTLLGFHIWCTANTLTGIFFCKCSVLRKLSLHYYPRMLCVHNGTLLINILSDGSFNSRSCINYCDCCVHYADYCYFKQGI